MARFVFQLEGVLDHRQRIEDDRQREHAVRAAELVLVEREMTALSDQVNQAMTEVRQHHMTGRLDMYYLAAHRRYMLAMNRQLAAMDQKIQQQKLRVQAAHQAAVEASKQKKIIEKLRGGDDIVNGWMIDREPRQGRWMSMNTQTQLS